MVTSYNKITCGSAKEELIKLQPYLQWYLAVITPTATCHGWQYNTTHALCTLDN